MPLSLVAARSVADVVPPTVTSRVATLLLLLLCGAPAFSVAACPDRKFEIVPNHSACLAPSKLATANAPQVAVRKAIVDYHNAVRREARAADMQAMVWNEELAQIAQSWANNCEFKHDGNAQRSVPARYAVGQNLAYGYSDWTEALKAWAVEKEYFSYGGTPTGVVGHYTQMVWSNTSRVGCGAAYCTNLKATLYVCDYAPAGNMQMLTNKPYALPARQVGEQCGASLKDGLCDCQGRTCYNGGLLNLSSCTCTCSAPHFEKPSCDLNCATAKEASSCSIWPDSFCTMYSNAPDMCPIKCKLCSRKQL